MHLSAFSSFMVLLCAPSAITESPKIMTALFKLTTEVFKRARLEGNMSVMFWTSKAFVLGVVAFIDGQQGRYCFGHHRSNGQEKAGETAFVRSTDGVSEMQMRVYKSTEASQ